MPEIGRFTDDLQNGKPSSSRQIEELVDRLERQLAIGGPSCSSDTLINVKNIVTELETRREQLATLQALDRALRLLDKQMATLITGEAGTGPFDSLVRRVEVAVGTDTNQEKAVPRIHDEYRDEIPITEVTLSPEMSMATFNYLTKYNLLENSIPTSPISPAFKRHHSHSQYRDGHKVFSNAPRSSIGPSNKILDEGLIKRMPKL